jgi:hypothetical protein
VNYWSNSRVILNDIWGPSPPDILQNPLGKLAEFTPRPRHLRDGTGALQLAHFTIDFQSGHLADGWQGAAFTPMGTTAVTAISGLPPWDPSKRDAYRQAIDAAKSILSEPRALRLEGIVPFLAKNGVVGYDTVKLFYLANAVQGAKKDLVVVTTSAMPGATGTVRGSQQGSGHGPPG